MQFCGKTDGLWMDELQAAKERLDNLASELAALVHSVTPDQSAFLALRARYLVDQQRYLDLTQNHTNATAASSETVQTSAPNLVRAASDVEETIDLTASDTGIVLFQAWLRPFAN